MPPRLPPLGDRMRDLEQRVERLLTMMARPTPSKPVPEAVLPAPSPPSPLLVKLSPEQRARGLLVQEIGADAVQRLEHGGCYVMQSKIWPTVRYFFPKTGKVRVIADGTQVHQVCIQTKRGLTWPDELLAKIKACQADETVLWGTGNVFNANNEEEDDDDDPIDGEVEEEPIPRRRPNFRTRR